MRPSGVITLTTDYGHKGPFVAVMRGVILSRNPQATVIDLTHDIPPQWLPEAGFWIAKSYQYFPAGTVHVGVVDPDIGTQRDLLLATFDDHAFIAPDNGLLAPLLDLGAIVFRATAAELTALQLGEPSRTFHGRDILAPIAAELAAGRLAPDDVGTLTTDWVPGWLDNPTLTAGRIHGKIVAIDAFGNLISNIEQSLLEALREPVATIGGQQIPMGSTYGKVPPGDYLALINSFGVVEIARSEGSASMGLGLERGAPITIAEGYAV